MADQEWLKLLISQLSPKLGEFASDIMSKEVEPIVKGVFEHSTLPADFKFERINMGTIPPKFTNIKTHKQKENEIRAITIDFDIEYDGDADIQVGMLGIPCGVRNVTLRGRGRVVLKPATKNAAPFFVGGAQFCLLEPPTLDFDMDGIANIADWPGVRRNVRKELVGDITKKLVYPNKVIVPMSDNVDPMEYKALNPKGLLAVKILRASELPSKKKGLRSWVGQASPDPYAKVVLGGSRFDTPVIKNTNEPIWDHPWFEYLLETTEGHRMNVRLFDDDTFSRDEFLGEVFIDVDTEIVDGESVEISKNLSENSTKHTEYTISGQISLLLRWMPFGVFHEYDGKTRGLLTGFVYSCNNLVFSQGNEESMMMPNTKLIIEFEGQKNESEIKKENQHPVFNYGFTYNLEEGWKNQSLKISAVDKSGHVFGTLTLTCEEIIEVPLKRKILSLSTENPIITITLSLVVKALTSE